MTPILNTFRLLPIALRTPPYPPSATAGRARPGWPAPRVRAAPMGERPMGSKTHATSCSRSPIAQLPAKPREALWRPYAAIAGNAARRKLGSIHRRRSRTSPCSRKQRKCGRHLEGLFRKYRHTKSSSPTDLRCFYICPDRKRPAPLSPRSCLAPRGAVH
jgi:hypothetical protein